MDASDRRSVDLPDGSTVATTCLRRGEFDILARCEAVAYSAGPICQPTPPTMRVERLLDRPIVAPSLHPSIGVNIQGPSLIRVPSWVEAPLGRYYLYFADHKGRYIRLAFADQLAGPWRVHPPGCLRLEQTPFAHAPPPVSASKVREAQERARAGGVRYAHSVREELTAPHIASPDVHVDEARRRVVMVFHGLEDAGRQLSRAAVSTDGRHFVCAAETLGRPYMRLFSYRAQIYALAMPGQFYRCASLTSGYQPGPRLFGPNMRHCAVLVRGDSLLVFWTRVGDAPERILLSRVSLGTDWADWRASPPSEVLRPERPWEGADAPLAPSFRSVAPGRVRQLRDPAVFEEDGALYLLYAVAGESGIAIARLWL